MRGIPSEKAVENIDKKSLRLNDDLLLVTDPLTASLDIAIEETSTNNQRHIALISLNDGALKTVL